MSEHHRHRHIELDHEARHRVADEVAAMNDYGWLRFVTPPAPAEPDADDSGGPSDNDGDEDHPNGTWPGLDVAAPPGEV